MELKEIGKQISRLRGDAGHPPDGSIIIPVNAQGDLRTVLKPLESIIQYTGKYRIEVVLVINNYSSSQPPGEIEVYRSLGLRVVDIPSARRKGEVIIVSARALGVQAAKSEITIHLDADCRVPDASTLLNWYIDTLNFKADLAYSHVGYYELRQMPSVYGKIFLHHSARWLKREVLRIPTTRGSNYGIRRSLFLKLYDAGKLSVDLQVGPAAKLAGARIVYSSDPCLRVLTSGRRLKGGWIKQFRYFRNRLHYNLKATPTRWRDVTRTSWEGFDRESDNRESHEIVKE